MTDTLTTFRIRLSQTDVDAVRELARTESCKRQEDVNWCQLIREAMGVMARERRPAA